MGCDISLCIYKLKTLEQAKKAVPGACFQDLYDNYIFTREYPDTYEFDSDEEAKDIVEIHNDVFCGKFGMIVEDAAIMLDKSKYEEAYAWAISEASKISLLDIVNNKYDEGKALALIDLCIAMRKTEIDWNTEFVVINYSF